MAFELDWLLDTFVRAHGFPATHVTHVPGRVNLIGEHIDYNGLPVLPMAIPRRITLAFRPRTDDTVRIANTRTEFEAREFQIAPEIEPHPLGDWVNYAKAAALTLALDCAGGPELCGFDGLVDSDLPVASGLSSSSALVISCALALREINHIPMRWRKLAELMAEGERYVGVRGGGMDQAICLGGREGCAARVDFGPLRLSHVPVPDDWRFLVANSLARAEKSGRVRHVYNQRTAECAEALVQVASLGGGDPSPVAYRQLLSVASPKQLLQRAEEVLEEPLPRRFRHVITEAERVEEAQVALEREELAAFGRLLFASHRSLHDDYEVSTPELDELVDIAGQSGAAGARLTGAGLGGCVLVVCGQSSLESIREALMRRYYRLRTSSEDLTDCLFEVRPSRGAEVMKL